MASLWVCAGASRERGSASAASANRAAKVSRGWNNGVTECVPLRPSLSFALLVADAKATAALSACLDAPAFQISYASSRSFCATARLCSFFSDCSSIWRIRSRVTLKLRPTSSRVRGCSSPSP